MEAFSHTILFDAKSSFNHLVNCFKTLFMSLHLSLEEQSEAHSHGCRGALQGYDLHGTLVFLRVYVY